MDTVINGVDYGPLAALLGHWHGDKGVDMSPEPDGAMEENLFYETLQFVAAGDVTNAEQQTLSVVRYHQQVYRKSDHQQFHDQVGYWLWDPQTDEIVFTLTIPRGVALVIKGHAEVIEAKSPSSINIIVSTDELSSGEISQTAFMRDNASTRAFRINLEVAADQLTYSQTTFLDIYGRDVAHTDQSRLMRASHITADLKDRSHEVELTSESE